MSFTRKNTLDQALDIAGSFNKTDNKILLEEFDGYGASTNQSGSNLSIDNYSIDGLVISGLVFTDLQNKFITISGANNSFNNGVFEIINYDSNTNSYIINNTLGVFPDSNSGAISWSINSGYSLEDDINFIRTDRKLIKGTSNYYDSIPVYIRPTSTSTSVPANLTNIASKTTDAKTLIINKLYKNITTGNVSFIIINDLNNLKHSNSIDLTGVPVFDGYDLNNYNGTYVEIIDPLTEVSLEVEGGLYDGYRIFGRTLTGSSISPDQIQIEYRIVSRLSAINNSLPFTWDLSYLPSNIDLYLPYRERLDLLDENSLRLTLVNGIIGDAGNNFVADGDLSGDNKNQTVIGIQTYPVAATAPTDGYYLQFGSGQWAPQQLPTFAPPDASYLTLSLNGTLTNERVLNPGTNVSFVDNGPDGYLTINSSNGITWATDLLGSTDTSQRVVSLTSPSIIPVTTGFSYGAAPVAVTGFMRMTTSPGTILAIRNATNTADFPLIQSSGANTFFGDTTASGSAQSTYINCGNSGQLFLRGGTTTMLLGQTNVIQVYPNDFRFSELATAPKISHQQKSGNSATSNFVIEGQAAYASATLTNRDGGKITIRGGLRLTTSGVRKGVAIALDSASNFMVEGADVQSEAVSPSRVLALLKDTTLVGDTTNLPTGSGDKVIYIANAAVNPTVNPVGGGYLYAASNSIFWMGATGAAVNLTAPITWANDLLGSTNASQTVVSLTSASVIPVTTGFSYGTPVSTTGSHRLAHSTSFITGRNAANTADHNILTWGTAVSNRLDIGSNTTGFVGLNLLSGLSVSIALATSGTITHNTVTAHAFNVNNQGRLAITTSGLTLGNNSVFTNNITITAQSNGPIISQAINTTDFAVKDFTINAQSAFAGAVTNINGGKLILMGGIPSNTTGIRRGVSLVLNSTSNIMVEAAEVQPFATSPSRVLALLKDTTLIGDTTNLPTGSGDKVIYLGDAAVTPTVNPVGGGYLYGSSNSIFWMGATGAAVNLTAPVTWATDLAGSTNASQTVVSLTSASVIPVTTGFSFGGIPSITGQIRLTNGLTSAITGRNAANTGDVNLIGWNSSTLTIGAAGATTNSLLFNAGSSGNQLFAVGTTVFGLFTTAVQSYVKEIRWAETVSLNPHIFQNTATTNHLCSPLTITAQRAYVGTTTGANKNGGMLQLGGGERADTAGRHGGVKISLSNNSGGAPLTVMMEAVEVQSESVSLSRVISLFKTTTAVGDTTTLPTGTGDMVLAIANCITAPTVPAVGMGILFVQDGALKYMGTLGTVTIIAQP